MFFENSKRHSCYYSRIQSKTQIGTNLRNRRRYASRRALEILTDASTLRQSQVSRTRLTDEALTEIADALFVEYDKAETADAKAKSRWSLARLSRNGRYS